MKSLKKRIQSLTESKDENVQKAGKELMLAFQVYEDKNKDISSYVKDKLSGMESQEAKEVVNYVESKYAVDNYGLRRALKLLEKSKAHRNDQNLRYLVNAFQLELESGVPEHMLVKSFLKNFKKYENVNEAAYDAYHRISQGFDKNKAHQLVANAIYALENDPNAEFLQNIINSLEMAFNLPGSHVKAFVYQALRDRADMHPALGALLEELRIVDAKTQEKINYYTDRFGRVAVSKRLSPVLEHKNGEKVFQIRNNLFVVSNKTMRKVTHEDLKKIMEHKDGERFLGLCRVLTNFAVVENKLVANDGIKTYTIQAIKETKGVEITNPDIDNLLAQWKGKYKINKKAGEIEITDGDDKTIDDMGNALDAAGFAIIAQGNKIIVTESKKLKYKFFVNDEEKGEELDDVMECLDGGVSQIGDLINLILSNFDLVNFLENVTTFNPEYKDETVDMMQDGNVIFVVVDDPEGMMGDVVSGDAEEIAAEVKNDTGIDITDEIDDEINEEEETDAEKEGELMELENELQIVEDNLYKIEQLDETLKEDDEIKQLEQELLLEKETLIKRIAELKDEVEQDGNQEEVIQEIIDQLSKLIQPEAAANQTANQPEATADGLPVQNGKMTITPHVAYKRTRKSIVYESFLEITGLSKKAKRRLVEAKFNVIPGSNLIVKLSDEEDMGDEVEKITNIASTGDETQVGDIVTIDVDGEATKAKVVDVDEEENIGVKLMDDEGNELEGDENYMKVSTDDISEEDDTEEPEGGEGGNKPAENGGDNGDEEEPEGGEGGTANEEYDIENMENDELEELYNELTASPESQEENADIIKQIEAKLGKTNTNEDHLETREEQVEFILQNSDKSAEDLEELTDDEIKAIYTDIEGAAGKPDDVNERDYSEEERQQFADKGWALPDGSFPIADEEDFDNAVKLAHQANDVEAAKAHIKKRAKELGIEDKIPDEWK